VTSETDQPDADNAAIDPEQSEPHQVRQTEDAETSKSTEKPPAKALRRKSGSGLTASDVIDMNGSAWSQMASMQEDARKLYSSLLKPLQGYQFELPAVEKHLAETFLRTIPMPTLPSVSAADLLPKGTMDALRSLHEASEQQKSYMEELVSTPLMVEAFANLAQQRRDIGKLIHLALQPVFATSTQDFLTTTDDLRYESSRAVWHYTSGYALMQVLSKNYLWASSPQNLNDSSEVSHGMHIISGAFDEARSNLSRETKSDEAARKKIEQTLNTVLDEDYFRAVMNEIYYISASKDPDSLTLWRNYANGDGFAIGFDAREELSVEGLLLDPDSDDTEVREGIPLISGWYQVHYSDRRKKKLADEFVSNALDDIIRTRQADLPVLVDELRRQILILASTMKHSAFEDEKEVRWMTTDWSRLHEAVHYEHAGRSIVPVLHIMTSSDDGDAPLPIRGIRCSPVAPGGIVRTIEGLLVQRGYKKGSKNVRQSEQPFKG
jgi:hypothetical protein